MKRSTQQHKKSSLGGTTMEAIRHEVENEQATPWWRREWFLALLLTLITLAIYYPAWKGQPIWDDTWHMTKPGLRSLNGLGRIWTEPRVTGQYYPFVFSIFWIEHRLWGDSTLGYHLLNIFLHSFSALLFFKLLKRLEIPGAYLAAAVFAVHPVCVES